MSIKKMIHYKKLIKDLAEYRKTKENDEKVALERLYNKNNFITKVSLIDEIPFYDTTWLITTTEGDVKISRTDLESIPSLCLELRLMSTIEEIKAIDKSSQLLGIEIPSL